MSTESDNQLDDSSYCLNLPSSVKCHSELLLSLVISILAYRKLFARGGGKPFAPKNLEGSPNFYERVGKREGPYYNNIGCTGI